MQPPQPPHQPQQRQRRFANNPLKLFRALRYVALLGAALNLCHFFLYFHAKSAARLDHQQQLRRVLSSEDTSLHHLTLLVVHHDVHQFESSRSSLLPDLPSSSSSSSSSAAQSPLGIPRRHRQRQRRLYRYINDTLAQSNSNWDIDDDNDNDNNRPGEEGEEPLTLQKDTK